MGYYTRHELEILQNANPEIDYIGQLTELSDYTDLFDDEIKWYDHEENMRVFSEKHPDTLFKLSGEGEESGDLWVEYYKNGKMQRCEAVIAYGDYNESKLK